MLDFAIQTARDAGRVLSERFRRTALAVTQKGEIDLVTEADVAAERLIVERVRSHYPRHSILAEEGGEVTRDRVVVFEVMAGALERAWWAEYRAELERRFRQERLVVRATEFEEL